jgi:hypothetical protein
VRSGVDDAIGGGAMADSISGDGAAAATALVGGREWRSGRGPGIPAICIGADDPRTCCGSVVIGAALEVPEKVGLF